MFILKRLEIHHILKTSLALYAQYFQLFKITKCSFWFCNNALCLAQAASINFPWVNTTPVQVFWTYLDNAISVGGAGMGLLL